MRVALLLSILLFPTSPALPQAAALFDELVELYPDTDLALGAKLHISNTARGVPVGVHVLVTGLPAGTEVRWQLEGARSAQAFRLLAVPVEQNTGVTGRTEAFKGEVNPHVIRRAPFSVFEVLDPIGATGTVDATGVLALRVEAPVPADATPGATEHMLTLKADEWVSKLRWRWQVYPVTVPSRSSNSRGFTNWFSLDRIAGRHQLKRWSDPFFDMLGKYADLMARSRQDTFWIRWRDFIRYSTDDGFVVDRARFERYVRVFLDRGFTRIEGGQLALRHKDDWDSPRLDLYFTWNDVTSPEGKADLAALLAVLKTVLATLPKNIEYLQHLADEPTDTNADSYRTLAALVRAQLPGVKIFEATMSRAVVGAVDHWCPLVHKYQQHRAFFEERRQAGDVVWVYTCLVPGGVWLNRLLDQERLRPVYIGWALAKYDLAGFLHWGFNFYRRGVDPFQQSVEPHSKGPPNFLPAGDSHVVFPGTNGPLSGQRLEAHRIGMEDAELLDRLLATDPRTARSIIDQVLRAFDDYETDVAVYRRAKRDLLRASAGMPPRFLRVLTYNIHHGEGMDGEFDYDRLAAAIRRADPDLVALQEVDRKTGRVKGVDQGALLAEKLGMHSAFGEAMPYDGGSYGEAILSRYPLSSVRTHPLGCAAGQEPRAALSVTVAPWGDDAPKVQFTGTHLCHQSGETRLRQIGEAQRALAAWAGPAIFVGDFNFEPDSPPYVALTATVGRNGSRWEDTGRRLGRERPTFGAGREPADRTKRIDIVWNKIGRGLTARAIQVLEEPLASDHLPVLVILQLDDGATAK